jgi:hypothetical protein
MKNLKNKLILSFAVICLIVSGLVVSGRLSRAAGSETQIADFYTAQKSVTTAGTAEQLSARYVPRGLEAVVKAKLGNTGDVTLGSSSANADKDSGVNFRLSPGEAIGYPVDDFSRIWIDADNNGDGVELTIN